MGDVPPKSTQQQLEEAIQARTSEYYVLRLYVAGFTARSQAAIKRAREICEEHLAGRYKLEVIDVYQQPALAKNDQVVAAPTLIKELPTPLRKIIGSLADEEKVLMGLDLQSRRD